MPRKLHDVGIKSYHEVRDVRKIYNNGSFNPHGNEKEREKRERERLDVTLFWELAWREADGLGLKGREKFKYTRLANVESEYDPKRKEEDLAVASVVNWPVPASWR